MWRISADSLSISMFSKCLSPRPIRYPSCKKIRLHIWNWETLKVFILCSEFFQAALQLLFSQYGRCSPKDLQKFLIFFPCDCLKASGFLYRLHPILIYFKNSRDLQCWWLPKNLHAAFGGRNSLQGKYFQPKFGAQAFPLESPLRDWWGHPSKLRWAKKNDSKVCQLQQPARNPSKKLYRLKLYVIFWVCIHTWSNPMILRALIIYWFFLLVQRLPSWWHRHFGEKC